MPDINNMDLRSGREVKEDGTFVNEADAILPIKTGVSAHVSVDSYRAAIVQGNAYKASFADPTGISAGVSYIYYVKNTSATKSIWLRPISFNSDSGQTLIRIVKNGSFTLGGTVYNPADYCDMPLSGTITTGSPYITGTFDTSKVKVGMSITGNGIPYKALVGAVTSSQITMSLVATASGLQNLIVSLATLPARNLNTNFALTNFASLKTWFQNPTVLGAAVAYADNAVDQVFNTIEYEMKQPSSLPDSPINIIRPLDDFVAILTNYGTTKTAYSLAIEWSEL